jgi:hypothetical protein
MEFFRNATIALMEVKNAYMKNDIAISSKVLKGNIKY